VNANQFHVKLTSMKSLFELVTFVILTAIKWSKESYIDSSFKEKFIDIVPRLFSACFNDVAMTRDDPVEVPP